MKSVLLFCLFWIFISGVTSEAVPLNGTCITNSQCSYDGTAALCQASVCVCRLGYKLHKANEELTCIATKVPLNGTCIANSQCSYDGTAALCHAGVCVCRLGYKLHKANEELTCIATTEKLCNPGLQAQNTTQTSLTVKWWCNTGETTMLKGVKLYYKTYYGSSFSTNILDIEQDEFTLTELNWETAYELYVEAVHHSSDTIDRSESINVTLPDPTRCDPWLNVKSTSGKSITLQWTCTNPNHSPIKGYVLKHSRIQDDRWKEIKVNYTQQEITLKKLKCGVKHVFLVQAEVSQYLRDESFQLASIVGGLQLYPERKVFLEVDESSVTLNLYRLEANCPVKTFLITLKQLGQKELIHENRTVSSLKRVVFSGLQPNTEYELHVNVNEEFLEYGTSYTFRTKCVEKALVIPQQEKLLELFRKYFVVHLEKWECADSFAVEYRKSGSMHWKVVSNDTKAEQKSLLIPQLSTRASYDVRITATNKFGSSVAEYPKLKYTDRYQKRDCGDWILFEGKCIKFMKEAGLLPKNDAQLVCNSFKEQKNIPSLVTVSSLSSEWDLTERLHVPGPVWLGLHSDDGKVFYRDDGSELDFTNWITQLIDDKTHKCVQRLPVVFVGKIFATWQKVSCNAWNYVVCEKPVPTPSGITTEELVDNVEELETTVGQLMERLAEAENKIRAYEKNLIG